MKSHWQVLRDLIIITLMWLTFTIITLVSSAYILLGSL